LSGLIQSAKISRRDNDCQRDSLGNAVVVGFSHGMEDRAGHRSEKHRQTIAR
jgi:hypothetical protein